MRKKMKYKLIYVVVFLLTTVFANAQDSLKEFENFKEKYNTKEFDYIVEKPRS